MKSDYMFRVCPGLWVDIKVCNFKFLQFNIAADAAINYS